MRSFVYLPLISTIVSLAFATDDQEGITPVIVTGMTSGKIMKSASRSGQNSPQRHQQDSTFFDVNPNINQAIPNSRRMKQYGYLCEQSPYKLNYLVTIATHACKYIQSNKQTTGSDKYPRKFNNDNPQNPEYIFPLLPKNKIFDGGYFNLGLQFRHFVVIDSNCRRLKVTNKVRDISHVSTKKRCLWPKCFFKGIYLFSDCTAIYNMPDNLEPEYFQLKLN